ncbi:MAG TPA: cytochrome c [Draconibacterium sp.]|nr:cytochrome c [Draconibacterium sp.]HRX10972.1 cytochrome c [Draconibacterium sp.]
MKKLMLIVVAFIILGSCGDKKTGEQKSVILQPDKKEVANPEKAETNIMANHPGKKVYESACLVCHMRNGSGVPGMHPPLTKSEFVNGDPDKLISIILKGLSGKMEIQGEIYNSIMPPQAHLSDQQIADVLTFIRGSFGNSSGEILPEQVQKVRNN